MEAVVYEGDCLKVMDDFENDVFDAIITDPPYALVGGSRGGSLSIGDKTTPYGRSGPSKNGVSIKKGFMGKEWDGKIPGIEIWQECLRVAKPGAHMLAFGGTRTHHRLMVAIEDAGWEIRDCLMWVYGSGFPKSLNISKSLDSQEQNMWIDMSKAIDNIDRERILDQWITLSKTVKPAGLSFQKNISEIGMNTQKNVIVQESVVLSLNQENEKLSAIIVELNSSEAPLTLCGLTTVLANADTNTIPLQNPVKFVEPLLQNQNATQFIITSIVRCAAKGLPKESTTGNLTEEEVLKTWLGKKKSLNEQDINVLCAGLTEGL